MYININVSPPGVILEAVQLLSEEIPWILRDAGKLFMETFHRVAPGSGKPLHSVPVLQTGKHSP